VLRINHRLAAQHHVNPEPSVVFSRPLRRQVIAAKSGSTAFWSGLSLDSKRLTAVGVALLLAMVVAVGIAIWNMRVVALKDARQNDAKLGTAVAEQTARSIQGIDLILLMLRAQITEQTSLSAAALRTSLQTPTIQKELSRLQQSLPQSDAFSIVDSQGHLVNFSRHWPVPQINLSDRGYFRHFRDHDDLNALVSKVMRNRSTGTWTFYVARRLDGAQGQFLGLVLGAVDLTYFQEFYQSLTTGGGLSVALFDQDGCLVASIPKDAPVGATLRSHSLAWNRIVASGHAGFFETGGVLRRGERLISVNPLRDYPLVVEVAVSKSASLAHWRQEALLTSLGTACAVLCMALLLRALTLQLRRLERSETSLAERNAHLEAARRGMESQSAALRASEAHLAEKSAVLTLTLDSINQGICMVDASGRIAVWNARALQLLDLPADMIESRPLLEAVVAFQHDSGEFSLEPMPPEALEAQRARVPVVYERMRPNRTILEVQTVPLPEAGAVYTFFDVTERRRNEDRIRHLALHDPLTGLANRTLLQQRLSDGIAQAQSDAAHFALLYLDLDGFKLVNDTRGHGVGDALLVQVAERLLAATRAGETVARTGGDEFAIAMPVDKQGQSPGTLARDIIALIQTPFDIDGGPCRISVSIGIAQYPDHAADASDLLRNADIALYKAKADGTGRYCVFESGLDAQQRRLFALEQDLRSALEREELSVLYQAIIETQSGQIAGCEALLRWHHPTYGDISPAEFIPLAEKLRLILPIGRWVMEQACTEAALWPEMTHIAVNLSPVQMNHETLIADVRTILDRTGLAPGRLVLEVTEGLLLEESSAVLTTMRALRALGIRFSLDDFGTGHSGLGYLRRFPFDIIKIDKLFVQDMVDQPDAEAIVGALMAVSRALNLDVVAEGVETEAQLTALRRRRCGHVQGFLMGRPQTAADIRPQMAASRVTRLRA
jgi:diguanylate cyclase (GGDEF)-like protein